MTSPTRKIRGLKFCASALNVGDVMLLFRTSAVLALNTGSTAPQLGQACEGGVVG